MKKLLQRTFLLLFALIAGSTSLWAADAGFSLASAAVPLAANANPQTTTITGSASETWNVEITGNWTSSSMQGSNGSKYWQMGKNGSAITSAVFSTSGITGTITSVVVNCASYSAKAVVNCTVGGSNFGTQGQATPTWASSTGGDVTFSGSASGAIAVTFDNSADGARAVYIQSITVTYSTGDAPTPVSVSSVSVDPTSWEMEVGETKSLTATVLPANATNKAVTWSSSADGVASVNASGVVTAVSAGTATITATTEDGGKTATCAVTVNAPVPATLTFDFADTGWGFPADYTLTEGSYTNGGYTFVVGATGADGHKAMTTGSGDNKEQVGLIFGKDGAKITLPTLAFNVNKIKVYGRSGAASGVKFNIFVDDVAVSDEATGSNTDHIFAIAANKQAAGTVYVLKLTTTDKNCQITKIEIFGNGCETGVVTAAGWASYVTTQPLRFAEGNAYVVSSVNSTTATLAAVTDVRSNTAVLLKGEGAKTAIILDEEPAAVANELRVSNGGEINGYVLAKPAGKSVGFYKWNGGSLASGKVYLPTPAGAPEYLAFSFGDATGIGATLVNSEHRIVNSVYDLQGRKVANPTKGLYIVNGKKVVIK